MLQITNPIGEIPQVGDAIKGTPTLFWVLFEYKLQLIVRYLDAVEEVN